MTFRIAIAAVLVAGAGSAYADPAKPKAAPALVITNARTVPTTEVTIGVGEKTIKLSKPLASQHKATLKLPKMSGCTVAVAATFEDASEVDLGDFDVCRDRTIRFTD